MHSAPVGVSIIIVRVSKQSAYTQHTQALALALQDDSHHRLRILRLGLDPDAFATTTSVGRADDNEQGKTEEAVTPQKQQEETAVPAPNSSSLLPLFAALQAGCCPRLTTLDIDGRVDVPSLSSSPVIGPLGGEAVDALDAAVRGGKLRRLEVSVCICRVS